MCANAEAQVLNAAEAAESTVLSLLTSAGAINTAEGQQINADFKTAIADIQAWKSGTPATNAVQVIQDIEAALPLIPLPAPFNVLVPIALGGLATILTLLGANSPAPAEPEATPALAPHIQMAHATAVAAAGEAKVASLTGYKPSTMDKARAMLGETSIAANRYKGVWNKTVDENDLPADLKAA